jgi:hypothetical protein
MWGGGCEGGALNPGREVLRARVLTISRSDVYPGLSKRVGLPYRARFLCIYPLAFFLRICTRWQL